MHSTLAALRRTTNLKHVMIARLVAGIPLAGLGMMHLVGAAPMRPILEAAKIPFPDLNTVVAPIVEVVAGLLLLGGAVARLGAALGCATMAAALYAHAVADWADEPPVLLPLAVLLACVYIMWRGAGAWSLDLRTHH